MQNIPLSEIHMNKICTSSYSFLQILRNVLTLKILPYSYAVRQLILILDFH